MTLPICMHVYRISYFVAIITIYIHIDPIHSISIPEYSISFKRMLIPVVKITHHMDSNSNRLLSFFRCEYRCVSSLHHMNVCTKGYMPVDFIWIEGTGCAFCIITHAGKIKCRRSARLLKTAYVLITGGERSQAHLPLCRDNDGGICRWCELLLRKFSMHITSHENV